MPDSAQTSPQESFAGSPPVGFFPLPYRRSIILFCIAIFFYWASLYFYVPILPVYAQSLGASLSLVGIVVASYGLPQLLLRMPLGVWFDTLSRRKPLVAGGIIMNSLGAVGLALAPGPWFLCAARAFVGIGAACWVALTVYFTAYYPREGLGRAISVMTFMNLMGNLVSTASGGVVAEVWGFKLTFFGAALLGILSLVFLLSASEPTVRQAEKASWHKFTQVATRPLLLTVSGMAILLFFVNFSTVYSFIPVYGAQIGASSVDLGIITMLSLGASAVAALIVAPISERWGSRFTIVLGSVLLGMSLLSVPFIHSVYVLEAVMVVAGLGRGALVTMFMALSVRAVSPQQRATAMGVYQAVYSVGMLLGPMLSGFLADSQGLAAVFYLSVFICLVIAGMGYLPILTKR